MIKYCLPSNQDPLGAPTPVLDIHAGEPFRGLKTFTPVAEVL